MLFRTIRSICLGTVLALASLPSPASAIATLDPEDVKWETMATSNMVHFMLRFRNMDMMTTEATTGEVHAQQFGAFLPNMNMIHMFNIPPLPPDSFFDIFFDVSVCDLPDACPNTKGQGPLSLLPCPPDNHWDGNIDIMWAGGAGHVNKHLGTVQACPGGGASYVHLITFCPTPSPWSITGLCAGWTATLVNEDFTPAPNPVPSGWTGFICTRADGTVPVNTTCCFKVNFSCGGVPATIDMCALSCECPTPIDASSWGSIKALYR